MKTHIRSSATNCLNVFRKADSIPPAAMHIIKISCFEFTQKRLQDRVNSQGKQEWAKGVTLLEVLLRRNFKLIESTRIEFSATTGDKSWRFPEFLWGPPLALLLVLITSQISSSLPGSTRSSIPSYCQNQGLNSGQEQSKHRRISYSVL